MKFITGLVSEEKKINISACEVMTIAGAKALGQVTAATGASQPQQPQPKSPTLDNFFQKGELDGDESDKQDGHDAAEDKCEASAKSDE